MDIQYITKDNIWWFRKDSTLLTLVTKQAYLNSNKVIQDLTEKYSNAYYIDFNNVLCNPNCIYKDNIHSLYWDYAHLSSYGSNYLGEKYLERGKIDPIFYKIKKLYKEKKGYLLQFNEKTKRYSIEKIKTP